LSPLLEIKDLHTEFRTGAGVVRAVDGISYAVEQGETVAIVGESGSGKSVSALSILRLIPDPPGRITRGEVLFAGRDLMQLPDAQMREVRGGDIGMVFQEPMTSLNPVLTIGRQITETLEQHRRADRAAAHKLPSSSSAWSASPIRPAVSSSIRTSSRAACANAS
jgi:ABC-type dipeptide/oligopeptide/nickel transport system ATPase component